MSLSFAAQNRLQRDLRVVLDALAVFREAIKKDPVPALHIESAMAAQMLVEAAEFEGIVP